MTPKRKRYWMDKIAEMRVHYYKKKNYTMMKKAIQINERLKNEH